VNKLKDSLNQIEEYTLGLSLLALAVFSCLQVITRYAFNYSFTWFEELSRYACVFLTFLGASLGLKYSTHFAMTALVDSLPYRIRKLVQSLVYLACALFFVVVAYYGTLHCLKHYRFGNLSASLRLPMYIPYLPIPVFSGVMAVRCLLISWAGLTGAISGDRSSTMEET
jgi:C4-dicarboxylate transporter DctQ subunit